MIYPFFVVSSKIFEFFFAYSLKYMNQVMTVFYLAPYKKSKTTELAVIKAKFTGDETTSGY